MTKIIKIINTLTFLLTYCVVLFTLSSCHQYYQTTKSDNNSEFISDTIYNPPNIPGAEWVIYGSGTATHYTVSEPLYLQKPLTKEEMDSLSKALAEWHKRYYKNDSLQRTDTINNKF